MNDMRSIIDLWDENVDSMAKDQIKSLLDGGNFVFFFKRGDDLFGCPESSRIIYATMKQPDEETSPSFIKEANFIGINITKALEGYSVRTLFDHKDIKKIKVIDSDEAYKILVKKADQNARMNLTKVIRELPNDDEDIPKSANTDDLEEK